MSSNDHIRSRKRALRNRATLGIVSAAIGGRRRPGSNLRRAVRRARPEKNAWHASVRVDLGAVASSHG
jgi:hypothetical protein